MQATEVAAPPAVGPGDMALEPTDPHRRRRHALGLSSSWEEEGHQSERKWERGHSRETSLPVCVPKAGEREGPKAAASEERKWEEYGEEHVDGRDATTTSQLLH